jgi:hypothetical protein
VTAAFARDCRSGKRLALVLPSTRLFSSSHQWNLATLHFHLHCIKHHVFLTGSGSSHRWRAILKLPNNGRWWQVSSPLIKQCQATHVHQCASTPDLSSLMLLFPYLSLPSKPPDNPSGLAFLTLCSYSMHHTVYEEALAPIHQTSMSLPLQYPSYPYLLPVEHHLITSCTPSILLLSFLRPRLHDHTLDSPPCTLRSHQSLYLFHADRRRTATMFRHRDELLTPPHSLRRRQQQHSRHSETGPPGFDLRSGHIISGTSNQMLDLSICHPSQAFSK